MFTDRLCIKSVNALTQSDPIPAEMRVDFWEDWANCSHLEPVTSLLFITIPTKKHQELLKIKVTTTGIEKLSLFPYGRKPKSAVLFDLTLSTPNPNAGLWMIG